MAQVKLFRKDDLTGFTVDRKRADLLIQTAGYTESYEEALAASTTLGGVNYTGTADTPTQRDLLHRGPTGPTIKKTAERRLAKDPAANAAETADLGSGLGPTTQ